MPVIKIESILGGHAPTSHFSKANQFLNSIGIDPALPIDVTGSLANFASGMLRAAAGGTITGAQMSNAPMWIVNNPKFDRVHIYDANGSLFAYDPSSIASAISAIADAGELSNSSGNGAAYFDNFLYLSKNTTVARYGPLDAAATRFIDGNFWAGTLGKTALSNTSYPSPRNVLPTFSMPNHVLHRHSDGRLYIADVTNNQGQIHFIKTTKTVYEGDTDNGSTYGALTFGYGLWPTALESYGADLAIAINESIPYSTNSVKGRAKVAFWDTTSTNFNKIIWVEFPDPIITAMKNINGVLYVASGKVGGTGGFRVSRFVGGYTFEEIYYSEQGFPPLAGAMDGSSKRLLFGSVTAVPEAVGGVYSLGLQKSVLSGGLFNTMRTSNISGTTDTITALALIPTDSFVADQPMIGWGIGVPGKDGNGLNIAGQPASGKPCYWWSQMFRIGKPFRIKRIRLPFGQAMAANMALDVKVYTDDASTSYTGATYGLPTLDTNSLPSGERYANLKTAGVQGWQNFFIEIKWSGSALISVNLPIEIDFELIDDE